MISSSEILFVLSTYSKSISVFTSSKMVSQNVVFCNMLLLFEFEIEKELEYCYSNSVCTINF